jgi:hypothetical protein
MRALVLFTASYQDTVMDKASRGEDATADVRMNDLLLPLVKGCGSERSYELLGSQSLQTLGGSGFLQEYPIEQYIRDAKIDTLYEGTTAIQGMDFFFRKVVRDQGVALTALVTQIRDFADSQAGNGRLKNERELLGNALSDVQSMVETLIGYLTGAAEDMQSIYLVGLNTSRLLLAIGDVVIGWLLLRGADVALNALTAGPASPKDKDFYEGKVIAAKFFAQTRLPLLAAERVILEGANLEIMELPESAF